jgi:hypothetical protein
MLPEFENVIAQSAGSPKPALELGRSREGRPVNGYRFGAGPLKISLIAGAHADEPVGPMLLDRVVSYLTSLPRNDAALRDCEWWIVPHINPDGAARNRNWSDGDRDRYDLAAYLRHAVRELPGDDVEFGFPRDDGDTGARPENRAVFDWWRSDPRPFSVHVSLHGMAFAGGPWYLIDPAWRDRCETLKNRCRSATRELGYSLHDVQRNGDKGFFRIERGFCTRPDSEAMAQHFIAKGDTETAARFRPSSMETIRTPGGDALTLVTEIPLFVLPGVGETVEPTDPVADGWRTRLENWREQISRGNGDAVAGEIASSDVRAVPIADHMRLQWETIRAGVEQVS